MPAGRVAVILAALCGAGSVGAQAADTLHRTLVADQATDGVGRIGRINDHPTAAEDFHGLLDQARLRIFRMNLEELAHELSLLRR